MSSFNMNEITRSAACRTSSKFLPPHQRGAQLEESWNVGQILFSQRERQLEFREMLNISIRRVNKIFMNWNPSFKYSKHPTFISSCLPKSTDFEPLNNSLKFFYRFKFYEILSVHGTLSEECKPQVSFKSDESNSNGRASTHFSPFFSAQIRQLWKSTAGRRMLGLQRKSVLLVPTVSTLNWQNFNVLSL